MKGEWKYGPAKDHGLSWGEGQRSLSREAGLASMGTALVWRWGTGAYLRVYHRLAIDGRERLPCAPPFVVAANHTSHLDAVSVASAMPGKLSKRVFPLAAGDTFFESVASSAFAANCLNALPVWRRRRSPGVRALEELRTRLVDDRCIYIIFPEGTRSRDGSLSAFKPGIGRLVGGTAVPVIPCLLRGTREALPPTRSVPRPRRITVRFGAPLLFSNLTNGKRDCRVIAAETEASVRALEKT